MEYQFCVKKTIVFNENTNNELRITITCGAPTKVDCVEIISKELRMYEDGMGAIECLNNYREQYYNSDYKRHISWCCNYDDKDFIYDECCAYIYDKDNKVLVEWKIEKSKGE